jgi:DNA-binding NtrC family response regulator
MNILVVESQYESSEELETLYNSFTDAEVDVGNISDIDLEEERENYDVVLSELVLEDDIRGPDVLDQFEADRKALYTVWRRDEADGYPEIQEALDRYQVIQKPAEYMDLEKVVREELVPQ